MRQFIVPLAVLVLAACSKSDEPTAPAPSDAPQASAPTSTPAAAANTVPQPYLGVWDYIKGSCDPSSDLRIEIKPRAIEFYEAHGDISSVTVESPEAIVIDLAMEGEGEKWTMRRRFTLSEGGSILTPTDVEANDFEPMPLKRCQT